MRQQLLVAMVSVGLVSGCSAVDRQDVDEPAAIRAQSEEERSAAEARAIEAAARYDEALAHAPAYRSDIRDYLIANPDRYPNSYRPLLDDFRGLASQFRCMHPPEAIARANADDWQLVKCDQRSAIFLRRHGAASVPGYLCGTRRSVPDEFETLVLSFAVPELSGGSDQDADRTRYIYSLLPNPYEEPRRSEVDTFLIDDAPDHYVIRRTEHYHTFEYAVLDQQSQSVISIYQKKGPDSCQRNSRGSAIHATRVASIDTPLRTYDEITAVMKRSVEYLGVDE
jgi:hypothetical protein